MSMEEWPDDHLDDLFRKSAEEHNVPFNPADWAEMSRRLDEYNRQHLFDRISRWGGIGALLLLLLTGLGSVGYNQKSPKLHQQTVAVRATPTGATGVTPTGGSLSAATAKVRYVPTGRSPNHGHAPAAPNVVNPRQVAPQTAPGEQYRAGLPELTNQAGSLPARTTLQAKRQSNRVMATPGFTPAGTLLVMSGKAGRTEQTQLGTLLTADAKTAPARARRWPTGSVTNPDFSPVENQPGTAFGNVEGVGPAAVVAVEAGQWLPDLTTLSNLSGLVGLNKPIMPPAMAETESAAGPGRRVVPRLSRLSVMVFASPDLSAIGLKNFERPGTNAGVAVQYQLTDRLSVNAGAMYSTKRYRSGADDYVLPWKWAVRPDGVGGVCTVIDIPVNLRYDWLLRPRGDGRLPARWFASMGLTSYFIQRETYNYTYENPADPRIMGRWGWDNVRAGRPGGSFGFSNLNLSAGYERPITNRLSWQVEPFLKIPLKEVGFFKVRLLSTGAFAGLRYRF